MNPLIRDWEGLELKAYLDTGGVWTIGYGHTKNVKEGDTCTVEQAEAWYLEDSKTASNAIESLVATPLGPHQLEALQSFVYNVGTHAFATSTMLRKLNAGDYEGAADQFKRWVYDNGKVIRGLQRRRAAEAAHFRKDIEDVSPFATCNS
jgi:lysozyme